MKLHTTVAFGILMNLSVGCGAIESGADALSEKSAKAGEKKAAKPACEGRQVLHKETPVYKEADENKGRVQVSVPKDAKDPKSLRVTGDFLLNQGAIVISCGKVGAFEKVNFVLFETELSGFILSSQLAPYSSKNAQPPKKDSEAPKTDARPVPAKNDAKAKSKLVELENEVSGKERACEEGFTKVGVFEHEVKLDDKTTTVRKGIVCAPK